MSKKLFAAGEVLKASDVNEFLTSSRNVILNGAFDIWQRGTSSATSGTLAAFLADRWRVFADGSGPARTVSAQSFAAGDINTVDVQSKYFHRVAQTTAGSGATYNYLTQRIEDVRTLANQTVVLSFYAKAAANIVLPDISLIQDFGTSGSARVTTSLVTNQTIGTTWTRYALTVTLPGLTGKTISTSDDSYLQLQIAMPINATFTFDIWGVQLEQGSSPTPFSRATPTIQSELAACQRYYWRTYDAANLGFALGTGAAYGWGTIKFAVPMRTVPSNTIDYGGTIALSDYLVTAFTSTPAASAMTASSVLLYMATNGNTVAGRTYNMSSSGGAYIGFSAEF